MSEHVTTTWQQTLLAMLDKDEDDWVARSVLNREAPMLGLADRGSGWQRCFALPQPILSKDAVHNTALDGYTQEPMSKLVHRAADSTNDVESLQSADLNAIRSFNKFGSETVEGSSRLRQSHDVQFKCSWPGCSHAGPFPRQFELNRHVKTIHERANRYSCRAVGCPKGQPPPAFARVDKLTAHIRSCHGRDTNVDCPVNGCTLETGLDLESMGIHIRRAHPGDAGEARGIANAASFKFCKCPVWSCGQNTPLHRLQAHLTTHRCEELPGALSSIHTQGLCITRDGVCLSAVDRLNFGDSVQLSVQILCPVCQVVCVDLDTFKQHFWSIHLFREGPRGAEHFLTWKHDVHRLMDAWGKLAVGRAEPWQPFQWFFKASIQIVRCSTCCYTKSHAGSGWGLKPDQNHHLDLLRPVHDIIAELMPYRMQIVRLYPKFETHPIFDDLNPAPNRQTQIEEVHDVSMDDVQGRDADAKDESWNDA